MTIKRKAFSAGDVLTASDLDQVQDNAAIQVSTISELSSLPSTVKVAWCDEGDCLYVLSGSTWHPFQTAWTSYTPTWTVTSGSVTLSNGTLVGSYIKQGPVCHFSIKLTFGSFTTVGTSTAWQFSLPITAAGNALAQAQALDSGNVLYNAVCNISSGTTAVAPVSNATGTPWQYNLPAAMWTANDTLTISGTYPV